MTAIPYTSNRRRTPLFITKRLLAYTFLAVGGLLMVIPFIWMLSTSLKTLEQVFVWPPNFIPEVFQWKNYTDLLERVNFKQYTWNTFKIAGLVTLGQLFTCSLAGYAFARLRFPGKNWLFLVYLATMMIPGNVTMIPNFIVMRVFGLVNTHTGLILPGLTSAFGTFLMRQFFLAFPDELEDAARLDGCTPFSFYWRILLPLSRPILATLAVMTFQGTWNDFLWPLIMINSEAKRTLQVGLSYLISPNATDWPILMAGSVLTLLPIIILFFIAQKYFVQSIKFTGIKG
jgi:multiple sugar transport system permease protein